MKAEQSIKADHSVKRDKTITKTVGHSVVEDVTGLFVGCCFVSLGVFFLRQAGLLTGGTAGAALLLTHLSHLSFGTLFVLLNLPFFWLAWARMGKDFTVKTFICIVAVGAMTDALGLVLHFDYINVIYAAVMGALLLGSGLLILFRHKASLGGFNIFALYMQDRFNIRAGNIQMLLDSAIVVASFFIISPWLLALSVLGAVITNIVLTFYHKPGRYTA
ncbi:YitT family protein [Shewanella sp. A3A]|uniref:YitT family protein n=1 Tax=Shewanella electrica TaxID=515560 RepID=A0ABT2FI00_9GAMM|nr:YitT family protein [Shewanella electrica]MCH1918188.1 YitT family protein [Shewanella ferrihydritica]MCH1924056.1 YitT family protein [Shewanella electrica]MCS4555959.1 YitT family protein [Shewanella electrica]